MVYLINAGIDRSASPSADFVGGPSIDRPIVQPMGRPTFMSVDRSWDHLPIHQSAFQSA